MREIVHLARGDARRVPWKNGRGFTEELALWPLGSSFERGDYDWRISAARVEAHGPFSAFPGFERILVVTAGDGLKLSHGPTGRRASARRFEPYRFSGDEATTAELTGEAVADFNVLARRASVRADVQVTRLGRRSSRESLNAGHAFLHVLGSELTARVTGEEESFELAPGESVWVREARAGDEIELQGRAEGCVALLVRLDALTRA